MVLEFKKMKSDDATKYSNFYTNSKAETHSNESNIHDPFESIYGTIISNMQTSLGKNLGWIIDSVVNHTNNISNYNPLTGSSYIKLTKELDHAKKGFINI